MLSKVRTWAGRVGEIRLEGDPNNPTISIQLSGVDTEACSSGPPATTTRRTEDQGPRAAVRRRWASAGTEMFRHYEFVRLARDRRRCDVLYANVRELPDESLRCDGRLEADRRLAVRQRGPHPDRGPRPARRVPRARTRRRRGRWSGCRRSSRSRARPNWASWSSSTTSSAARTSASTPSTSSRPTARSRWRSCGTSAAPWPSRCCNCLEAAYGIRPADPGTLDQSHDLADHFQSLDGTFKPRPPAGANLGEGLRKLVEQALAHQYPAHPEFPELVA